MMLKQKGRYFKAMKLLQFSKNDDWGKEYSLGLLLLRKYAIFQGMFCICTRPDGPYFHVSSGMGRLFEITIEFHRIGIFLEFFALKWECFKQVKDEYLPINRRKEDVSVQEDGRGA